MKHRLRKAVKWTLTVLAVLTLVAWVGSRWWGFSIWGSWGETYGVAHLSKGQIWIEIEDLGPAAPEGFVRVIHGRLSDRGLSWGFRYRNYSGWQYGSVFIPLWFPFLILAAPAGWLWWRGDRRFPETACQSCGYDISGAPHERCPECGKEIQAESPRTVL